MRICVAISFMGASPIDPWLQLREWRRFGQCAAHTQALWKPCRGNLVTTGVRCLPVPLLSRRLPPRGRCFRDPHWLRRQAASSTVDVAIVGAGAAGIAAARNIAAAGRRYVLIEATDHIGGRCITDTTTFGVPYDRGAHWLYLPDLNPLTKLTPNRGDHLSGAAQPEGAHRPPLCARRRARRFFVGAGARHARHQRTRPQDRCAVRTGDARRSRRLEADGRIRARPVSVRQGSAAGFRVRFRQSRRAQDRGLRQTGPRRVLASLAQGLNVQLSTPANTIDTRGGSRPSPARARSMPAPRSSPCPPM